MHLQQKDSNLKCLWICITAKEVQRYHTAPELNRGRGSAEGSSSEVVVGESAPTRRKHSIRRFSIGTKYNNNEGNEGLELTETERHELEQENIRLSKDFETLVDKTREIEKQMYEISNLHTTFASKVLEQTEVIEYTHNIVMQSVAAVEQGKKEKPFFFLLVFKTYLSKKGMNNCGRLQRVREIFECSCCSSY